MPNLPLRIEFASYLTFTTNEQSTEADKSNTYKMLVKNDKYTDGVRFIQLVAERIAQKVLEYLWMQEFFGGDVLAIAVPGSGKYDPDNQWVPREICKCLEKAGLVGSWSQCLRRAEAVPKSSFSKGNRASARRHYETISSVRQLELDQMNATRILLVDDVVTRGATMAGAYMRAIESFPNSEIKCFAYLSTRNFNNFVKAVDPARGAITINDDWSTQRSP